MCRPSCISGYDGRDIVLPDDPDAVLRVIDSPYLGECIGHDIVTASGLTLLGADNKSGVAEIMTAAEYLLAHPGHPHGAVRIAFTPDEEVGQGTKYFDVPAFGAHCAYTMDGGARGELEFESFSADAISITFRGFNTHPGFAKGRMVNAIKLAARFIDRLPADRLSPETTEALEGFVHPYVVQAGVDRTTVKLLVRDFVTAGLQEKEAWLVSLAREVVEGVRGASVESRVEESYRNMREVLDDHPLVVDCAREAISAHGNPGPRARHPRRHRRLAPLVHGAADAEHLRGRAELPLTARVGVRAGHGEGRRGDRRAGAGLGRAGIMSMRTTIASCCILSVSMLAGACGGGREAAAPGALRIAVVPKGSTHEHWKRVHAGAEKAAAEYRQAGVPVDVLWKAPIREDDREQQVQVVEGFISQRVNGLVLAPLDSHALLRPVEEAAQCRRADGDLRLGARRPGEGRELRLHRQRQGRAAGGAAHGRGAEGHRHGVDAAIPGGLGRHRGARAGVPGGTEDQLSGRDGDLIGSVRRRHP